jgi:hypothetical protein
MAFKLQERLYGPVCAAVSIGICSLLLFVTVIVQWFNVRMAVLAPIVASLCYASSLFEIVERSVRNFWGIIIGGGVCVVWLVILRGVSNLITGSRDYNPYIAVAVALPWLIGFFVLLPRRVTSISTTTLMFLTMTMYCGDSEAPDAFPLRAILSGSCGALIPIAVAFIIDKSLMSYTRRKPHLTYMETKLWFYWDLILDEAIVPGIATDLYEQRSACLLAASSLQVPRNMGQRVLDCISALSCLHSIVSCKRSSCFVSGESSKALMELRSRKLGSKSQLGDSLEVLDSLSRESIDSGPRTVSNLRVFLMLEPMRLFLQSLQELRRLSSEPTKLKMVDSFRDLLRLPKISWVLLAEALRFSAIMVGLGELLVYWDAQDDTVDTYALWAFAPALLLAERVTCVGQAIRDGFAYTLGVLTGSVLGILALLVNAGARPSFIAEYILVGLLGLSIQVLRPSWGDTGLVIIVAWIICVLGNLGFDPSDSASSDTDTTGGLNILWRVALYRSAITSFSVFVMALSFVVFPTSFASKSLDTESIAFASSIADTVCERLSPLGTDADCETEAALPGKRDCKLWMLHMFATEEYRSRQRYAKAECVRQRYGSLNADLMRDLWANFLGLLALIQNERLVIANPLKPLAVLQEAIRGVVKELEPLSSFNGLTNAEVSLITPRARQLREAVSLVKRWLLTGDYTAEMLEQEGIIRTFVVGICMCDFLKKWVLVERHFGLHEEFEFPRALRDNSNDSLDDFDDRLVTTAV